MASLGGSGLNQEHKVGNSTLDISTRDGRLSIDIGCIDCFAFDNR